MFEIIYLTNKLENEKSLFLFPWVDNKELFVMWYLNNIKKIGNDLHA